jgi:hypothetical protein
MQPQVVFTIAMKDNWNDIWNDNHKNSWFWHKLQTHGSYGLVLGNYHFFWKLSIPTFYSFMWNQIHFWFKKKISVGKNQLNFQYF